MAEQFYSFRVPKLVNSNLNLVNLISHGRSSCRPCPVALALLGGFSYTRSTMSFRIYWQLLRFDFHWVFVSFFWGADFIWKRKQDEGGLHYGTWWNSMNWSQMDFLIWAFNTSFSKFAGHERSYLTATRSTPQARQPPSWTSVIFKPSKMSFSEKKYHQIQKDFHLSNIIKVPTQNNIK